LPPMLKPASPAGQPANTADIKVKAIRGPNGINNLLQLFKSLFVCTRSNPTHFRTVAARAS
jgi:hypothetical protein